MIQLPNLWFLQDREVVNNTGHVSDGETTEGFSHKDTEILRNEETGVLSNEETRVLSNKETKGLTNKETGILSNKETGVICSPSPIKHIVSNHPPLVNQSVNTMNNTDLGYTSIDLPPGVPNISELRRHDRDVNTNMDISETPGADNNAPYYLVPSEKTYSNTMEDYIKTEGQQGNRNAQAYSDSYYYTRILNEQRDLITQLISHHSADITTIDFPIDRNSEVTRDSNVEPGTVHETAMSIDRKFETRPAAEIPLSIDRKLETETVHETAMNIDRKVDPETVHETAMNMDRKVDPETVYTTSIKHTDHELTTPKNTYSIPDLWKANKDLKQFVEHETSDGEPPSALLFRAITNDIISPKEINESYKGAPESIISDWSPAPSFLQDNVKDTQKSSNLIKFNPQINLSNPTANRPSMNRHGFSIENSDFNQMNADLNKRLNHIQTNLSFLLKKKDFSDDSMTEDSCDCVNPHC